MNLPKVPGEVFRLMYVVVVDAEKLGVCDIDFSLQVYYEPILNKLVFPVYLNVQSS